MENEVKVGERYGRLVVLRVLESGRGKKAYCLCKCDCGRIGVTIRPQNLLDGIATECLECEKKSRKNRPRERSNRGGNTRKPANPLMKHPLHRVWSSMIMRCENPKRPFYNYYGGRGVKVCEEWRNDYLAFYKWSMENGYQFELLPSGKRNRYTIDRIDLNGDYCPENCRWVDYREQNKHRRNNLVVEFNGETKEIKEFLKDYNVSTPFFFTLLREGMTEMEALETIAQL